MRIFTHFSAQIQLSGDGVLPIHSSRFKHSSQSQLSLNTLKIKYGILLCPCKPTQCDPNAFLKSIHGRNFISLD